MKSDVADWLGAALEGKYCSRANNCPRGSQFRPTNRGSVLVGLIKAEIGVFTGSVRTMITTS